MRARFLLFGAIALASILAACGGGGGGSNPAPPTPTPTSTPTSGTASVTFSAPTSIPLVAGYAGTMQLPQGSGTATITMSTTANSNTSTLDTAHLKQTGSPFHTAASAPSVGMTSAGAFNGFLYVTITATGGNVVLQGYPGFTLTNQSSAFYLAQYYATFWYSVTGPSAISGSTNILLPVGASPAISIPSGTSIYLALYTGGVLPSPNPFGCVGVQGYSVTRNAQTNLVGVQPIHSGASATYTGSLTEALSRSQPCAMPTATSQATVSVTVSESPDPDLTDMDENSVEIDNYATNSTQVSTTAVVSPVPGATISVQNEKSETSTDLSGDKVVTTYSTPVTYTVTSPLPYTASPIPNAVPATVKTTLADGSSESRAYTAPGVYTETDSIAGLSGLNTIAVKSDGSATYNINASNFASQGIATIALAFSAPTGGTINWTGTFGSTTPETLAIPAWFSASSPLYSDTLVGGATMATLPAACSGAVGVSGLSFAPLTRTITNIDPALGTSETETITSYIAESDPAAGGAGAGPVCVVIADTQNLYYDYFLDTPAFFYFAINGQPIQTDTINESYYWSVAPTGLTRVRDLSGNRAAMASLQASINAHTSGIAFARLVQRARRIEAIDQSIATKGLGGVK